jgi:hypothetical protein
MWLSKPEGQWPKSLKEFNPETYVYKESKAPVIEMAMPIVQVQPSIIDYGRFSQHKRLKNATGYFLRAIKLFKSRLVSKKAKVDIQLGLKFLKNIKTDQVPPLEIKELEEAELFLIKDSQRLYPHRERKHAGTENLAAAIRQKFWVPRCRSKEGDVVIIEEPKTPKSCWKLGIIHKLVSHRTAIQSRVIKQK